MEQLKKTSTTGEGSTPLWMLIIAAGAKAFLSMLTKQNATEQDIYKIVKECELRTTYDNNHTQNLIKIDDNKTANKIDILQAETDEKIRDRHDATNEVVRKRELFLKQNHKFGIGGMIKAVDETLLQYKLSDWIKQFHSKYAMPTYKGIPLLREILDGCPDDYRDAMTLHLLTALGGMCFSKVRAQYGEIVHSPSLLTVIEGKQGSGKGKFNLVYKKLFQRVIEQDREKLANENPNQIIQTTGINISAAKFIDMLAANKGVHLYAIETEIAKIRESSYRKSCLSSLEFRKAFDNDEIDQNNKNRTATQGRYPIYLNCTLTGTPQAINRFFNEKEVEGGTARRFCFAVIPEIGAISPSLHLPTDDKLETIRDLIDKWRSTYCFYHDPDKGDTPCPEHKIKLDYVVEVLEEWSKYQYKLSEAEHVSQRNELRNSITTIAFRCAMVLHMLLGEPKSNKIKERKNVKQFAVYIADYCMERYLTKFIPGYYHTSTNEANTEQSTQKKQKPTWEDIEYWYPLRGTTGIDGKKIGYGTIAKYLGINKDDVRNAFKRYERKMGLK